MDWRQVRSYVLRSSRMTGAQRRAIDELWARFGLARLPEDPVTVFGRHAPCVLEIGFGNGEALLARAKADPARDYLGLEVYRPGIGHVLLGLAQHPLPNVRLIEADAAEALYEFPAVFSEICVWFPDPWPKKRHHKRRLIQPGFVSTLARALRPRGLLHLATDDPGYAQTMREAVTASGAFMPAPCPGTGRPESRFGRRAQAAGHPVEDFCYLRLQQYPQAVEAHP
ncbi:MAG: tRNA (guanosine(46)-N7)-methyltransferase TrmB [Acidiferrobacteraceae bacterium]